VSEQNKKSLGDLSGLLCSSTLRSAIRASEPALSAREGLKELLTLQHAVARPCVAAPESEAEFSRWVRCLDLLVEEFLQRKAELLRLNKARREQIENFLRTHTKEEVSLEKSVQARVGSPEQEALLLFAHQVAVFQLLQILLVKRWGDRGLLSESALPPGSHTLNWQITGFLKRKGLIGRHDWSFLKQNLFSWYSPTKETWERLRLLLEPVSLAQEDSEFPARLLRALGERSRLSLLGFHSALIDSRALWQLLLEQKAADERLPSIDGLDFATGRSGPILVSGLGMGESLHSLRSLTRGRELHGVWAYSDSDFERYLSEMYLLWDCASEMPRINLLARAALKELSKAHRGATLFHDAARPPLQAQFAVCFQDSESSELEDAVSLLEPLKENGLLLIASEHFWPTDDSVRSERLRENVLKHASVRLIIDLRQLTGSAGESLPKGITILEKCESRELRDSNRPQLLRARGHLQKHQVIPFWSAVLEHMRLDTNPGDVNVRPLSSVGEGVRLEWMSAAASQQQLRSSPWITLSDPLFYEASSRLRRSLHKAHTFGSLLRWKPGMAQPSRRGIVLQEQGKFLHALLPTNVSSNPENPDAPPQFLFLPDISVAEHPLFFLTQVYSAPVQFWFRLEMEQATSRRVRAHDRQAEQRLKLMPLLRLFEPGTLVPTAVQKPGRLWTSLEDLRRDLARIFRQGPRGMAENARLHEIILALENTITQNIELGAEFTRHLFPDLQVCRWDLPASLPEVAPRLALEIFRHLDSSPLAHHPAIQVTKLRNTQDFKVTKVEYTEMPMGGMAELKLFHGIDPAIKLLGPSLILRAASEEFQKRLGRPWRETGERLSFPTDVGLVHTQLREVVRSAERQLASIREHISIMDQIFCCLFGLSSSFADESTRQAIRHHLSPQDSRVHVQFLKETLGFRSEDSESPIGLLQ
jgi:hypothetical protein